jgi:hypothetical protein
MKAMRKRIALQKHRARNIRSALRYFVRQVPDFWSAHAPSRRFGFRQNGQLNCPSLIFTLAIACFCVTSCATISSHGFSEPTDGWQTKIGQLMYRSPKTTLIGDALVRVSRTGDFQLTVSKGPGITLLSLRQDATFAEVKGAFARQGWSGPVEKAPPQLRGWFGLRDQFVHAPDQKTLRYVNGNETFLFRF